MNVDQLKRFNKLKQEEFYLLKFDNNKFYISGSTKNVYIVDWFQNNNNKTYGSFFCNCPDMKNHARKANIYCKHICFVYNKIGKFNRLNFYEDKWLSSEETTSLQMKLDKINSGCSDETIQNMKLIEAFANKLSLNNNTLTFTLNKFNKCIDDDECPICFDIFTDCENLFCQCCGNAIHKKCIEKWLEKNNSCVYCRSDVWKHYGKINNVNNNVKNDGKYINLEI